MDYRIKKVTFNDGVTALIQLWDTSSSNYHKPFIRHYLKVSNGFIIMYNIAIRQSFENAEYWLKEIRDDTTNNNIVLVGSHIDVDKSNDYYHRWISTEEGKKLAEDYNVNFYENSNKTGYNVNEYFDTLINRKYENETTSNNIKLDLLQNKSRRRICLK